MIICKNDDERKLRKAIYIGDGGQVTTLSGRSLLGGPDRSQGSRAKPDTVTFWFFKEYSSAFRKVAKI